ncbi:MAG TPA: STAS/SEC14 domain-containing protein [Solirubrobacterales bacterium]|nr:STAS/SEC14 domain-containing protein [Solirubrobacterales bacterium]
MIERIAEMPAGTIGLRATAKLTKADYTEVLEPALREGVESGELRLLFVLADFDGLESSAIAEDFKTGMRVWFHDHSAWKRFALVTDAEWVAKAMHMFAWMTPGEVLIRDLDGLEEAKSWVAA